MTGIILNSGKYPRFRCDKTKVHYRVRDVYDVDGNIRTEFKFPNGHEVEAIENEDGTVTIKFAP